MSESPSSLVITFIPAPDAASVSLYKATAADQSCEAAANQSPLTCTINNLSGGTAYTVQAVACLLNGDCSPPRYEQGFTLPLVRGIFSLIAILKHIFKSLLFPNSTRD